MYFFIKSFYDFPTVKLTLFILLSPYLIEFLLTDLSVSMNRSNNLPELFFLQYQVTIAMVTEYYMGFLVNAGFFLYSKEVFTIST